MHLEPSGRTVGPDEKRINWRWYGRMAADETTASAKITPEALKVIPDADKRMAGRSFGGAIANIGAVAEDVTLWARLIVSVPRQAGSLIARIVERWRRTPGDWPALPSPKLLLEAAADYSTTIDDDLKTR